ncbi:hypothetical protein [Candidatus Nitrosocosmicus arcticus]|uniref:Uncharacterized protein n=1 Tax=Candidatus Nitrosocosmicus arcticus TaxID=2035267 RepID=A0A557SWG6_9ARCH|nr:hypothetical protein [Candidatus Nitrosocosmicus arcticus]TVP40952.1 hypothetical protein NARC_50133 [Candidatus Nitrosocosmicus arcticus]
MKYMLQNGVLIPKKAHEITSDDYIDENSEDENHLNIADKVLTMKARF